MENDVTIRVSKYVSYLLRHNPEDLEMDDDGFVDLSELVTKVRKHHPTVNGKLLIKIVDESERKRFEIVDNKIRALYGHSIPVRTQFREDKKIKRLYHGTTPQAAKEILKKGLRPMKRRWVHLSPTEEVAKEIGKRRTNNPMVLVVDAFEARKRGIKFYKASDKVYVCKHVPAKYIKPFHV